MNQESQMGSGTRGGNRGGNWKRDTGVPLGLITPNPKLRVLDQVREVMRLKHYAIRTERSYCDWIKRYVRFHRMNSRAELLAEPEAKIEEFLSDLAVNGHVAASTQNQAFNGLLFLYREILHQQLDNSRPSPSPPPCRSRRIPDTSCRPALTSLTWPRRRTICPPAARRPS
jgi:hypothetical protein